MTDNWHLVDRDDNRYIVTKWKQIDVTICGFFSGAIRNYAEWVYANLGYGNAIEEIEHHPSGKKFTVGKRINFIKEHFDNDMKPVLSATIKSFYVDVFSQRIGVILKDKIGKVELKDLLQK